MIYNAGLPIYDLVWTWLALLDGCCIQAPNLTLRLHLCAWCCCERLLLMPAGAATPLRDAWSGGRTPMHPSMEDGAGGYDGYGPTSQRGATPSYAGGGYAGTPFNPSSDDSRHVRFDAFAVLHPKVADFLWLAAAADVMLANAIMCLMHLLCIANTVTSICASQRWKLLSASQCTSSVHTFGSLQHGFPNAPCWCTVQGHPNSGRVR